MYIYMLGSHISESAFYCLTFKIRYWKDDFPNRVQDSFHYSFYSDNYKALELEDDFQTQDMTIISLLNMKHSICAV